MPGQVPTLPSPLALVCHDAGACNLILPWLSQPGLQVQALMQGPALALWQQRFGQRPVCDSLEQALHGAAALLSGTGWASDLEHRARALALQRGLRSMAVIDHWVNYPMRFERAGQVVWPDDFWVTDADALALAQQQFPGAHVRCWDNLYLAEQLRSIPPLAASSSALWSEQNRRVLYVLEPMRSDWGRGVQGEWQALDYFWTHRAALGIDIGIDADTELRLRPHPSDPPGKYRAWLSAHTPARLDDSPDLATAIARSAWVVGCESNALVVALAAGRRVVSSLPPWAPACRLPQSGLIHLRDCLAVVVKASERC